MMERLVLVDEHGREIGTDDKLAAHQPPGRLHRAISVFVMDRAGRILLQRRARGKYHFGGLWANAACSHPAPGEAVIAAGERRLREEMGLDLDLEEIGVFTYQAVDPVSGLVEHEFDHVLLGRTEQNPIPDPGEVDAWRWAEADTLRSQLGAAPPEYAPWLEPAWRVVTTGTVTTGTVMTGTKA